MQDDPLLFQRLAWDVAKRLPNVAGGRTLLVTSVQSAEGKSYVAEALATALSVQTDARVSLVECGETPGRQGTDLDALSWSGLVGGNTAAVKQLGAASGPYQRIPHGADVGATQFRAGGVARALDVLRGHFGFVVLDGPVIADCGELGECVDGTVLVINAANTRREAVIGGLQASPRASLKLLGAVLNERPRYLPRWLYRRAL